MIRYLQLFNNKRGKQGRKKCHAQTVSRRPREPGHKNAVSTAWLCGNRPAIACELAPNTSTYASRHTVAVLPCEATYLALHLRRGTPSFYATMNIMAKSRDLHFQWITGGCVRSCWRLADAAQRQPQGHLSAHPAHGRRRQDR